MERSGEVFPASHGHYSLPLRYLTHSCSSLGSADDKSSARVLAQKHLLGSICLEISGPGLVEITVGSGSGAQTFWFTCITWSMTFNFLGPQCPHAKL